MNIKVQIVFQRDNNEKPWIEDVACLQRGDLLPENLGITLHEGKELLAKIQEKMVALQSEEYLKQHSHCLNCGTEYTRKGMHSIKFRTLFGSMELKSPRFYTCSCLPQDTKSFSPLAELLPERMAPEMAYLQTKWSSLMSYGLTVDLLKETLPINTSITTTVRNTQKSARRIEDELEEEKHMYIDGCERDWEDLPIPGEPFIVGIDGGYVHGRDKEHRKAGSFEVIVGKSIQGEDNIKRFGFVNKFDQKSKRRLFETLQAQGLQMNQDITFLSDGGDTVRDLQLYLSPQAEHILDWFHITMRITVMNQMIKGLASDDRYKNLKDELERIKWFLWHGNVFMSLNTIQDLEMDIEVLVLDHPNDNKIKTLLKNLEEFHGYISNNRMFIPNYGDRYHYGETISTAFVESTVNEVVSRRMVKKQQMRWTQEGCHLLLQVRIKTLNDELRSIFCGWYPEMSDTEDYNSPSYFFPTGTTDDVALAFA